MFVFAHSKPICVKIIDYSAQKYTLFLNKTNIKQKSLNFICVGTSLCLCGSHHFLLPKMRRR